MNKLYLPLACLALASSIASQRQGSFTLFTDTDVGVYTTNGQAPMLQFTAKGTDISKTPLKLQTRAQRGGMASCQAGSMSKNQNQGRGGMFRFSELGNLMAPNNQFSLGTTASTNASSIKQGPHSYLLTLTNMGTLSLVVTYLGEIDGTGKGSVKVDVGADNQIEFSKAADGKAHRATFQVNASTSAKIRITMDASATGSNQPLNGYNTNLELRLQGPQQGGNPGIFTRYGRACGQANFNGQDRPPQQGGHSLNLRVANAFPNENTAIIFGAQKSSVPLPGAAQGCLILTAPLLAVGVKADATGSLQLPVAVTGKIFGTAYLQAIPLDMTNNQLKASNGLRFDSFD